MKKFNMLYNKIINNIIIKRRDCGNKNTGFEIPQYSGSLTDYSMDILSGKNPKLDKNKQNRIDCPNCNEK